MTEPTTSAPGTATALRRTARPWGGSGLSGALFGVAVAGFVDEVVFHQLLHWHHFYDRSTAAAGLVSDGLFHAFSFFAAVAGLFLLAELRRRDDLVWPRWVGAALVGAGAFQLYDGTVQHKLLELHQVRPGVPDQMPYDVVFIGLSLVLIAVGLSLLRRSRPAA